MTPASTPHAWTAHLRLPEGHRVALHSARDPLTEARRQLAAAETGTADAPSIVVLVGAGLGFVTEAARERWPDARIVVLEPAPDLARQARARTPALYTSDRVQLLTGAGYDSEGPLWRLLDQQDGPAPTVIVHPVMARVAPHAIAEAVACAQRAIGAAQMNARAREENAGRYLLNTLRNLASLANGADLSALQGRLSGIPIVVVGAGPSLDRQLPALRRFANRALVIAADTAWRPLAHAGIDPHLVVALDPTEMNGRHLLDVPARRLPWLLAELSIDPRVPPPFQGRTAAFRVATHHPWPWLHTLGLDRPVVRAWGSVLTAAVDIALTIGGSPIVLAGADLAFTNGRPYCRGTTFEETWARATAHGWSLRRIWEAVLASKASIEMPDVNGASTVTAPHLIEFKNWIVDRSVEDPTRRMVNATGQGILAGGRIEQATLESMLEQAPDRGRSIDAVLDDALQVNVSSSLPRKLRDAVDALERQAAQAVSVSREHVTGTLADWLTFGRPSLTVADIQAALRDARGALDERSPASSSHLGARVDRNAASPEMLLRMPLADRAARMRARLTGDLDVLDGVTTEPPTIDRLSLEARQSAIDEAVTRLLNLDSPLTAGVSEEVVPGADPRFVPLSYRFAWTRAAAPVVAVLEEALFDTDDELARASGDSRAAEPFWSKPVRPLDTDEKIHDSNATGAFAEEHPDTDARLALVFGAARLTARSPRSPRRQRMLEAIARGLADPHLRLPASEPPHLWLREGNVPLRVRVDALSRVLTGTFVPLDGSLPVSSISSEPSVVMNGQIHSGFAHADDTRMVFVRDGAGWIEPDVLTDRGVPPGWICATADERRASFLPHPSNRGLLIDTNGDYEASVAWPAIVTGERPWGQAGGAVAWNRNTSQLWFRPAAGRPAVEDNVPFRPFDMVLGTTGTVFWIGDTGGLWEWSPSRSGHLRFIADTPPGRLGTDESGLIVHPIERDATNRLLWRHHTYAWRYDVTNGRHERIDVGPEGDSGRESRRGSWTARTSPFASRITLRHDHGRTIALACYAAFGVAWAGDSLLATTMDGDVLLFRDVLRLLNDQRVAS